MINKLNKYVKTSDPLLQLFEILPWKAYLLHFLDIVSELAKKLRLRKAI